MIDLFDKCEVNNVANCDDDAASYSCATNIPSAILELQVSTIKLFNWFKNNNLKVNPRKFHIILSTKKQVIPSIQLIEFLLLLVLMKICLELQHTTS